MYKWQKNYLIINYPIIMLLIFYITPARSTESHVSSSIKQLIAGTIQSIPIIGKQWQNLGPEMQGAVMRTVVVVLGLTAMFSGAIWLSQVYLDKRWSNFSNIQSAILIQLDTALERQRNTALKEQLNSISIHENRGPWTVDLKYHKEVGLKKLLQDTVVISYDHAGYRDKIIQSIEKRVPEIEDYKNYKPLYGIYIKENITSKPITVVIGLQHTKSAIIQERVYRIERIGDDGFTIKELGESAPEKLKLYAGTFIKGVQETKKERPYVKKEILIESIMKKLNEIGGNESDGYDISIVNFLLNNEDRNVEEVLNSFSDSKKKGREKLRSFNEETLQKINTQLEELIIEFRVLGD